MPVFTSLISTTSKISCYSSREETKTESEIVVDNSKFRVNRKTYFSTLNFSPTPKIQAKGCGYNVMGGGRGDINMSLVT